MNLNMNMNIWIYVYDNAHVLSILVILFIKLMFIHKLSVRCMELPLIWLGTNLFQLLDAKKKAFLFLATKSMFHVLWKRLKFLLGSSEVFEAFGV